MDEAAAVTAWEAPLIMVSDQVCAPPAAIFPPSTPPPGNANSALKFTLPAPASKVTIHVTGFKKFHGVAENPTEVIVKDLKAFAEERGLPAGVTLGSCTVLDAAGDGALPVLYKILDSGISNMTETNKVIWLHLGVNSGSVRFAVEWQAVNEATFRYPDEFGWQPQKLPIVSEDGEISLVKKTLCSALAILESLKAKSYNVMLSEDAGRFVCNYVYYHSLRFAEQKGHKSLFVHVPLYSKIDKETQMRFVHSLLEAIASTC